MFSMTLNDSYLNNPSSVSQQERLNVELKQLVKDIWRVGDPTQPHVPFGQLFDDDDVQQQYEGLAATLKAAKKRGIVTYKSPILLKGAHDKVIIDLIDKSPLGSPVSVNELTTEH